MNALNDQLAEEFGIRRLISSAYHPQTNGLDERTNKTLKERLSRFLNSDQNDWHLYLEGVAYSIRTQKQASTKYSPFFLLYHRQPNHISAVVDSSELTLEDVLNPSAEELEDHVVSVDEGLSSILDTVRNNVKMAQEKQKSSFQKRALKGVKVFNFSVGDLVLRKNMRNVGRKGDRLAEKWNGPYRYCNLWFCRNSLATLLVSKIIRGIPSRTR